MKRGFLVDDAAGACLCRAGMPLDHIAALNENTVIFTKHLDHLTTAALVAASSDDNLIALLDLEFLRRDRMYEFMDRLVNIALPRVRDFRGLNGKSFDGRGNYAMGIKEQIVFPEIDYDQVDEVRGMDIIVVTSARTDDEARELLANFQFPFVKA